MNDPHSLPGYQAGHHWVSSLNFEAAVQEGYAFPKPITIYDSTLRKIMLTTGLRPSVDDMLHVADALEQVGIREVFFNLDWWGDAMADGLEFEVCRALLARDFAFRITVPADSYVPLPVYDVERYPVSAQQAVDTVRDIGGTIIEPHLIDPRSASARARQRERLEEVFSYAQSQGMTCVLALPDIGWADFAYLVDTANLAIRLGATRVDLHDGFCSLSPEAMKLFVSRFRVRMAASVPVTLHVHDDFGIASAVVIAAATAGAHPDVAVNGLSYRAGFAALEEVALTLELLYGVPTGLRLDRLQWLSGVVAERSGLPNHPLKPITGSHAFLRDLPPWVASYLRGGPEGFPPVASCFAPSVVGGRMQAVFGSHCSNWMIREKLIQMGISATEEQVREIRQRIQSRVEARVGYPCWLTEQEVETICRTAIG